MKTPGPSDYSPNLLSKSIGYTMGRSKPGGAEDDYPGPSNYFTINRRIKGCQVFNKFKHKTSTPLGPGPSDYCNTTLSLSSNAMSI